MHKERKDKHFVKKPIYPGGLKAMRELIRTEMKYPKDAMENKVEGVVFLKYDVDYTGKVISSKVMSGIGHGCDEEAQRLVSKFKFQIPKGPRKMKVLFHKSIKIHFKLPKQKPKKVAPKPKSPPKAQNQTNAAGIQYTITQTQTPKKENSPKPNTYSYSIKIN